MEESSGRSLRSKSRTSRSSTSSARLARQIAKQEVARLKLSQLAEEQELERQEAELKRQRQREEIELKQKREREEEELKFKKEAVKAKHSFNEASLERQVLEEELDRGGYLPDEGGSHIAVKDDLTEVNSAIKTHVETKNENLSEDQASVDSCSLNANLIPSTSKLELPTTCRTSHKPHESSVRSQYNASSSKVKPPESVQLRGPSLSSISIRSHEEFINRGSCIKLPEPHSVNKSSGQTKFSMPTAASTHLPKPQTERAVTVKQSDGPSNSDLAQLASLLKTDRDVPRLEVEKFDGDPSRYVKFMQSFEVTVNTANLTLKRKLLYLVQHCEREAKRLIEFCLLLDPEDGYDRALELLRDNYGRPNVIVRSYCNKIIKGPHIKAEDSKGLNNLAHLLEECSVTLKHLKCESDLNNFSTISSVVKRLPFAMQTRWLRTASDVEKRGKDPTFEKLVKFVKDEAEIANSAYATAVYHRPKSSSSFFATTNRSNRETRCPCCNESHTLESCSSFSKLNLSEKRNVIRKNRLCNNCFKRGHIAKFCRADKSCDVTNCKYKHHKLLHFEPAPETSTTEGSIETSHVVHYANRKHNQVFLNVVPVRIYNGNVEICTYAFLDQGSTTTLCEKWLLKKLGITGPTVSFTLTTVNKNSLSHSGTKTNLSISGYYDNEIVNLEEVLSVDRLPIQPNVALGSDDLERWPHLADVSIPSLKGSVSLLIGIDNPELFWVLDEKRGEKGQPYGVKTKLGWSLIGTASYNQDNQYQEHQVNFVRRADQVLDDQLERLWTMDILPKEAGTVGKGMSKEDRLALHKMEQSRTIVDGHYQVALPWKPGSLTLQNNRAVAEMRLKSLQRRMERDEDFKLRYTEVINGYLANNYASRLSSVDEKALKWYLPHHAVQHPRKPEKLRVVFDCSASFRGTSLNKQLLPGPDFLNSLVGVLLRFRINKIALVSDIENMFHQVRVAPVDHTFLRFLWWPNGDTSLPPQDHCMQVHLFGATSSPSCVNYCLLQTATDNATLCSPHVPDIVKRNFYMDDCLASLKTEQEAIKTFSELSSLLQKGGFRLTKWSSNSKEVMQAIPSEDRAKSVPDLNKKTHLCVLGLKWDFESDDFYFETVVKNKPLTKRGILSIVCSLFDPLGFVSPVILQAKLLLQNLSRQKLNWDDAIPDTDAKLWNKWLRNLTNLNKVIIPRHAFGVNINDALLNTVVIHHFADASSCAYAVVTYVRFLDTGGNVHCRFLFGKSRLAPLKSVSIPRLELTAAVLAVKIDQMLQQELNLSAWRSIFWTDSTAVLLMLRNTNKRFSVFVSNRLTKIEEHTTVDQWRYVSTKDNPADVSTRGLDAEAFFLSPQWISGPKFLLRPEDLWPEPPCPLPNLPEEFATLTRVCSSVSTKNLTDCSLNDNFLRFSSWFRLKKAVAWVLRYKSRLLRRQFVSQSITVDEIENAEKEIIKCVQRAVFAEDIARLANGRCCGKPLSKLNPFLCEGLVRVGGRIQQSCQPFEVKHPVILPASHHVTKLIIEDYHQKVGHSGSSFTWNAIRQKFWIVRGSSAVRKTVGNCLSCKRRNSKPEQQIMADLPKERFAINQPAFYCTGTDYFGPFLVKQGRSMVKRYGCIFTCLTTRAVHLEVAHSMTTDSFLNAFRRFICRRGIPHTVYSDNGTNLVGAEKELRTCIKALNNRKVENEMQRKNIRWKFNPPAASNFGGVWERLIRSTRKILMALTNEQTINDEALTTVFAETESILNSRPLTPICFDPQSNEPLTPNHLLMVQPTSNKSPGVFSRPDRYSRKRWRQVQYLADQFWVRWSREYLHTLQVRQKWQKQRPNIKTGDVVLICDKTEPRGKWNLARVLDVYCDRLGNVRQALLKTATNELRRPVNKLCPLITDAE